MKNRSSELILSLCCFVVLRSFCFQQNRQDTPGQHTHLHRNGQTPAKRVQHFIKHFLQHLSHIVVCCLIMFISYNTIKHVFKADKVDKGMWRENYFCCAGASTTEYNKVAWGGQTSTTSYNIAENKRNVVSYNICFVKSLAAIKLHTTRYNTIQHDTTRWPNECNIS